MFSPKQLQDLVQAPSYSDHRYFVTRTVSELALKECTTFDAYAIAIFDDVFDRDIALHCKCKGETHPGENSVDNLLAILPEEPLDVFIGTKPAFLNPVSVTLTHIATCPTAHCINAAKTTFKVNTSTERQLRLSLIKCINGHLRTVRGLVGLGPRQYEYGKYQEAMRRAKKRKIDD